MSPRVLMTLALLPFALSPALAQTGPLLVDAAEIYCTDAGRPGFSSFGVTYSRTMPSHFGAGLAFCRVDMKPSEGPSGDATTGWTHNAAGQTMVWCRAKGAPGADAVVRVRFELFAIPAGLSDASCTAAREGRLP